MIGAIGIALGIALIAAPVVLVWNESEFLPPGSPRFFYFSIAGQLVATVAGFLMGVPLMRRRRCAERRAAGLCPACGYDLRATPGRCPECGGGSDGDGGGRGSAGRD